MPTEAEFRSGALAVSQSTSTVTAAGAALSDLAGDPGIHNVGSVALTVYFAFDLCVHNLNRLGDVMDAISQELSRRADVCHDYTQSMGIWRSMYAGWERQSADFNLSQERGIPIGLDSGSGHPGPAPLQPDKPEPWVEEG